MTIEESLTQLRLGPGINEDVSEEYNDAVNIAIKALEQEELYKVDHNKMLLDAAKMIKEYCVKHNCVDCPFYYPKVDEECAISSRDYLDATYPNRWEV